MVTAHDPTPDKAWETLVAQSALAGHVLYRTDARDGPPTYFVGKWGMTRSFTTLHAVEAFIGLVSGEKRTVP